MVMHGDEYLISRVHQCFQLNYFKPFQICQRSVTVSVAADANMFSWSTYKYTLGVKYTLVVPGSELL